MQQVGLKLHLCIRLYYKEFGKIMHAYSVCKQYAFYDAGPVVKILLENFDQRVFDRSVLTFA